MRPLTPVTALPVPPPAVELGGAGVGDPVVGAPQVTDGPPGTGLVRLVAQKDGTQRRRVRVQAGQVALTACPENRHTRQLENHSSHMEHFYARHYLVLTKHDSRS